MKTKIYSRILLISILAGASLSTQASTYTEIAGSNIDFYYDTDFWGAGAASVSGNTITFNTSGVKALSNVNSSISDTYAQADDRFGVIAVAKTGYVLNPGVSSVGIGGNFTVLPHGYASISGSSDIYSGTFASNTFSNGHYLGRDAISFGSIYNHPVQNQSFNSTDSVETLMGSIPASKVGTLGVSVGLTTAYSNLGNDNVSLTSASYSFGASPIAAVPEPETYLMLLAGVGLTSALIRRRKQK